MSQQLQILPWDNLARNTQINKQQYYLSNKKNDLIYLHCLRPQHSLFKDSLSSFPWIFLQLLLASCEHFVFYEYKMVRFCRILFFQCCRHNDHRHYIRSRRNIHRLVLNRKSFRDHSPIGLEKWIFGILRSDVKNSCACALTLPLLVFSWR